MTITSIILYILDLMKRLFATTLRTHFSLIILITTFDPFVPRLVHQQNSNNTLYPLAYYQVLLQHLNKSIQIDIRWQNVGLT